MKGVIGRNLAFSNWSVIFRPGSEKNRLQDETYYHMIMGVIIIWGRRHVNGRVRRLRLVGVQLGDGEETGQRLGRAFALRGDAMLCAMGAEL